MMRRLKNLLFAVLVCNALFSVWSLIKYTTLQENRRCIRTPCFEVETPKDGSTLRQWNSTAQLPKATFSKTQLNSTQQFPKVAVIRHVENGSRLSTRQVKHGKLTVHQARNLLWVSGSLLLDSVFPKPLSIPVPLTTRSGYLIPNLNICASCPSLLYVVIVHTAPTHFDRRQSMRETWANVTSNSRTVFLLGKTADHSLQAAIVMENQRYGDIVQGDFFDHYNNLTLKAVMGLRWLRENCRNARFVVKVDDDVFVNIYKVKQNYFPVLDKNPIRIICQADKCNQIARDTYPNRIVPAEYFKDMKCFPMPMCHEYAMFFSIHLAIKLFERAKVTPFFFLEDVYVSGILAAQIENVTWTDERRNFFILEHLTHQAFENKDPSRIYVGTVRSRKFMNKLWSFAVGHQ